MFRENRSRPPAGQHQQNDKRYVNMVNVNKVNVQVNVNKVNVKVNVNKVNDKVNDIYSIHSHYKGGAACGRATTEEVPRPSAAAPLLWFPL